MRTASLRLASITAPSVLCLGAHCDDIEIGCGGTLIRIAEECSDASFDCVIFCSNEERAAESRAAVQRLLGNAPCRLHFLKFRDGYLPYEGGAPKEALQRLAQALAPDLILTHYAHDAHQDHRLVSEITSNVFRDHLILEYEIPKFDGDLGRPNVYVPLEEGHVSRKIAAIIDSFATQTDKHWFTEDTFRGLLCLRGIEAGRSCHLAEAFYNRKLRLSVV
jgi:LmbE family N-acetylglucosaminyl deacetylase